MEHFNGLLAFVHAARWRSFVAAGERLGLSPSAVGKSVSRLEERLGVRLMNRSTRRLHLTEEGELFFERCQRIVAELENAEAELSRALEAPRGRLRVSLPSLCHRLIMPVLPEFARRYPDVTLELDFNDRLVDVIAEGMDLVIRSGALPDSQLKAKPLMPIRLLLVATPAYFSERGIPASPRDLERHACLRYRFPSTGLLQEWDVALGPDEAPLVLNNAMVANSGEALLSATMQGLGIAYLPDFAMREALADGSLVSVLEGSLRGAQQFSMLWPSNRNLLPKLRALVDFLEDQYSPLPARSRHAAV